MEEVTYKKHKDIDTVELHQRIGRRVKLEVLNLGRYGGLEKLPDSLGNLRSLVELNLSGTRITELPDTIGNLKKLRIGRLVKLEVLNLGRCGGLEKLPVSLGNLRSLAELDLLGTRITELPDTFGNLKKLRVIKMTRIKIKELPSSIGMLKRLEVLDAELCRSLVEIPSTIEGLTCLRVLKLRDTSVCRLPPKLPTKLDSLSYISFWYCKVRNLAGFCLPESLCELDIACCFFLKTVSALSHLKNLKKLEVSSVTELVEIRDLGELECLQTLNISYCDRLKRLENLSKLKRPKTIEIRNCQKFKGIDDISELESLETLHIQGCDCEDVNIQRSSGEMGSSPGSGALKIWIEVIEFNNSELNLLTNEAVDIETQEVSILCGALELATSSEVTKQRYRASIIDYTTKA
ncbi:plant intracellular Ras-group-related LRR protein 4-like [Punica granatum]|uniref:Plant intracellular Ras-group-related LRR protein 4-like n=1 Tax=Punica granatum TaxID=22663 RepID=A0A6P8CTQ6_PUNGR|nr:plant intracellular Ras-group-related LRR protein 4-like [Punica granatum]